MRSSDALEKTLSYYENFELDEDEMEEQDADAELSANRLYVSHVSLRKIAERARNSRRLAAPGAEIVGLAPGLPAAPYHHY